jgi:purine-nucleoside phosphorylase
MKKSSTSLTAGRPNTQLPMGALQADVVLCCGEDLGEFKSAVAATFGRVRLVHGYRCFAFLERGATSFIWTGIGSGCLEPLLCEIFDEPRLRRIILVGTAGAVSKSAPLGVAMPIREARVACAGVAPKRDGNPPNWPAAFAKDQSQRIVSTDYYYGFTLKKAWPAAELWSADARLAKTVAKAVEKVDLVDMESGQFYHLCRTLRPDLEYLAIKGAANPLADFSQQPLHSESVLHDALGKAKGLLGVG